MTPHIFNLQWCLLLRQCPQCHHLLFRLTSAFLWIPQPFLHSVLNFSPLYFLFFLLLLLFILNFCVFIYLSFVILLLIPPPLSHTLPLFGVMSLSTERMLPTDTPLKWWTQLFVSAFARRLCLKHTALNPCVYLALLLLLRPARMQNQLNSFCRHINAPIS